MHLVNMLLKLLHLSEKCYLSYWHLVISPDHSAIIHASFLVWRLGATRSVILQAWTKHNRFLKGYGWSNILTGPFHSYLLYIYNMQLHSLVYLRSYYNNICPNIAQTLSVPTPYHLGTVINTSANSEARVLNYTIWSESQLLHEHIWKSKLSKDESSVITDDNWRILNFPSYLYE